MKRSILNNQKVLLKRRGEQSLLFEECHLWSQINPPSVEQGSASIPTGDGICLHTFRSRNLCSLSWSGHYYSSHLCWWFFLYQFQQVLPQIQEEATNCWESWDFDEATEHLGMWITWNHAKCTQKLDQISYAAKVIEWVLQAHSVAFRI